MDSMNFYNHALKNESTLYACAQVDFLSLLKNQDSSFIKNIFCYLLLFLISNISSLKYWILVLNTFIVRVILCILIYVTMLDTKTNPKCLICVLNKPCSTENVKYI